MTHLRELLVHDVVTVTPGTTVAEARHLMRGRVPCIALVLANGRCIGVIAERDLPTERAWSHGAHTLTVGDLTLAPNRAFPPETDLMLAAAYLHMSGAPYLLVLEQGRVLGVVCADRVFAKLAEA